MHLFVNPLHELKLHFQVFQSFFQGNSGGCGCIHILVDRGSLSPNHCVKSSDVTLSVLSWTLPV